MSTNLKEEKIASIRSQLFSWLLIPIVSLCLVSAVISYLIAIKITTKAYDAALTESARELANRLQIQKGRIILDLPAAALAILKEDKVDKSYYAAFDDQGNLIDGDPEILPNVSVLQLKHSYRESVFLNQKVNHENVRLVCLRASVPEAPARKAWIYVAETVLKRQSLISEILEAVVLPQVCLISLASLAVWFGVARGLAPLDSVRKAIASRTQWDLRPVAVKAPIEIQPLVLAIDDLLNRLNKDIESQHRFIANAAHQLRTPLAGLKTQTELALRAENWNELSPILAQVDHSATNVTRVVNQLLSLAKLEPSSKWLGRPSEIDLNSIIKEATSDLVPLAVNKEIDLGFEGLSEPAIIKGDKSSIRELVTNLIDNAITYTPAGGKVTVKLVRNNDLANGRLKKIGGVTYDWIKDWQKNFTDPNSTVDLLVEDDGPGIPESEREKVFERFYRVLGNNVSGSGLGLAIVREIVQAHDATVWIASGQDGKGTVANVRFPAGIYK